ISLDSDLVDGAVKITIKDTGIGMSKEYQDHMFNLFSQESTGYTKNFQGMGLGLALAHRYLMLINCKIQLESAQDVGTIFTIYFPVDASNSPVVSMADLNGAPENAPSEASEVSRMSILVVEDDPNSQKLASFTLSKDYNLHFADSVADAKDVLNAQKVQLILLDLSLRGDEDGLELARFLRKDETKWLKVPIIALTAHAFTSDRDRCMEAGCNDFMTKPFRLAELKETIQHLL
ncbi:MAG: response regulator, partial [Candidatus Marinimicrobia bacterium]|nr:response regulator [Candidatus Neomarinimicrobiota bacterium]